MRSQFSAWHPAQHASDKPRAGTSVRGGGGRCSRPPSRQKHGHFNLKIRWKKLSRSPLPSGVARGGGGLGRDNTPRAGVGGRTRFRLGGDSSGRGEPTSPPDRRTTAGAAASTAGAAASAGIEEGWVDACASSDVVECGGCTETAAPEDSQAQRAHRAKPSREEESAPQGVCEGT